MTQTINNKEVKDVVRFEKWNRPMVQVVYNDDSSEIMSAGDFGRNVKRMASEGSTVRFETTKSEAYIQCEQVALNGLEAKSKQSGLGRWRHV